MNKLKVGILGATGMVGQRFVSLLDNHPWFELTTVAASPRSAGKSYEEAVAKRWAMSAPIPETVRKLTVLRVEEDMKNIVGQIDFVFSALDLDKEKIREIEEAYAALDIPVVSNNSAHRWTDDIPMLMPEVNPHHAALIDIQRKNRGWNKGFIAVKPNCSIQCYVPPLSALWEFDPQEVVVSTYQAISGAGKTFDTWPEMVDNIIPYIGGEEEKSEKEPMKIWASLVNNKLNLAEKPIISATCVRVPTQDGHLATVRVNFKNKPSKEQILSSFEQWKNPLSEYQLPSAPPAFIKYLSEEDRPQTKLDRDEGNGMTITIGRLHEDRVFDWKFVCLSHNTIRGAAGGAILVAELLKAKGYL